MRKTSVKGLVKKCDAQMSKLIRERGKCDRCGRSNTMLHWAHVFGRRNRTLRWDVNNAMALCYPCHNWWHENPTESGEWFKDKYPVRYEYLSMHANKSTKRKPNDYKQLLEDIKAKNYDKLHL